jgi:NAD(P)-dependent dehydrogenase (short-subunit alcohol dehydrogenase family)
MAAPLVALVTAGSAGTGEATARRFATEGMRVVVNYANNTERAEAVVKDLESLSPLESNGQTNFVAIRADLGDRSQIIKLVDETVSIMGKLDVVFSNGGWTHLRNFSDLNDNVLEEDWDKCFNMNVKSHLFLMHAAKEHLDKTQGAFITTASLAGVKASGSSLVSSTWGFSNLVSLLTPSQAYSVTKAAQIHLVKGLAISAGPNIRVNTVSPGLMLTV